MQQTNIKYHPQTLHKPNGETFTFNMVEVPFTIKDNGIFLVGEYLVTQNLYQFVTGKNPSKFLGEERPVEQVSWFDAIRFCNQLSDIKGLKKYYEVSDFDEVKHTDIHGEGYRLPTGREWKAMSEPAWFQSMVWEEKMKMLLQEGWFKDNSHMETKPVGLKKPNGLGLYDVFGNVEEWGNHNPPSPNVRKKSLTKREKPKPIKYGYSNGGSWEWWLKTRMLPQNNVLLANMKQRNLGFRIAKNG